MARLGPLSAGRAEAVKQHPTTESVGSIGKRRVEKKMTVVIVPEHSPGSAASQCGRTHTGKRLFALGVGHRVCTAVGPHHMDSHKP